MSASRRTDSAHNPLGILASLASPAPAASGQRPPASASGTKTDDDMLLKTPKLCDNSPDSLSPPHSPSTQAAIRKTRRDGSSVSDMATDSADNEHSRMHPSAIPATQLDVLALVTATSPPMPSRRRWTGHSTPKPAFSKEKQTPVHVQPRPVANENGKHSNGDQASDEDTVSEDEQTLRSYSSRARARHQSVRMRPLPKDTPMRASVSARAPRVRGHQARNGDNGSDGDTTETDEEMSSHAQTPVPRRSATARTNPLVLHYPGASPRLPPASEPTMRRRPRQRISEGTNLSKQLSGLEEADEPEGSSGRARVVQESRDSSLSLSPPLSPSRQQRLRSRRMRMHGRAQRSGSETETDTDMAARLPGSETETDMSNSVNGGAVSASGRPRALSQRSRLPPMPPMPPRNGAHSRQPRAGDTENSGGETTETDEDFFGPSRAVHSSIRPPRRVVRHLASLRAHQQHPAALDLGRHAYMPQHDTPATEYYTHTAPVSGSSADGTETSFGLGISSGASIQWNGSRRGSGRNLSTPSMAAGPALASAVRGAGPLPPPQPHYPQANAHEDSPVMRRDPFAPAPNDLTYRGAALRRLERSSGTEPGPAANRKRALTAPSSYDAPLRRRVPYGIGGKMISSTDSLLEDDREDGLAGTGYCTPPERSRHIGNRGSLLGESPVSSLRSSLLARTPMQPPTRTPQASTSHVPPTSSAEDEPSVDVLSGPGSPSMDAALRQSRKRRRSPSQQSPQPTASISPASRRRLDMSPAPDGPDAMFPPIDRDAS